MRPGAGQTGQARAVAGGNSLLTALRPPSCLSSAPLAWQRERMRRASEAACVTQRDRAKHRNQRRRVPDPGKQAVGVDLGDVWAPKRVQGSRSPRTWFGVNVPVGAGAFAAVAPQRVLFLHSFVKP